MRAEALTASRSSREQPAWSFWLLLMIRVHPQLTALIVSGTLLRIITMVAFRPAFFFHTDSYGYMRIAQEMVPSPYRPSLYPLLLRLVFPFHSLLPVVVVQHLAGLAMGIGVYALLRRLGVGPIGGALGAAPLFIDAYQLHIEHDILSETLFQVLVLGALFLIVVPSRPSVRAIAVAGALLGLAGITRVVGVVVFAPALGYLLWRKVDLVKVAWFAGAFVLPLLMYAGWFFTAHGAFAITQRGNLILYGRVSPFADCVHTDLPDYQRVLCDERPPSERPGTEFYVWRTANRFSPLRRLVLPPGKDREEVLGEFAHSIILAQPFDYARVVIGDLVHYIAPGHWEEPRDAQSEWFEFTEAFDFGPTDPKILRKQHETGDDMPKVIRENRGSPEPNDLFGDRPPPNYTVVAPLARFLDGYQAVIYTWGPLLAVALLLGAAGSILRPVPGKKRSVRPECFLFTSAGVLLILAPAATAVFDYRYLIPVTPLLTMGGVLGAYTIGRLQAGHWDEPPTASDPDPKT